MNRVLVVDDSLIQRTQIAEVIKECGHQPVLAADGLEALNIAQKNSDLKMIICDFNMPIMDGLTMCKKLRAQEAFSLTPIIMLTSEACREYREIAVNLKISAWVLKPFNIDVLKEVIGNLVPS